jgi:hypothetical protein
VAEKGFVAAASDRFADLYQIRISTNLAWLLLGRVPHRRASSVVLASYRKRDRVAAINFSGEMRTIASH